MSVFNQSRSYIIRFIFIATFIIIIAQLFHLQVLPGKYKQLAMDNAVFPKRIYPPRGIIFDRKNKAILNNTLMYDLMVTPNQVKGVDTAYVCDLLEIDTAEFKKRIVNAIIRNGRYRPSVFEGLLSPQKHARLEENMWRFNNGFYLQERPVRVYPFNVAAQVLGDVGEVDSGVIARSGGYYIPGDYIGTGGLESTYETVLRGQRGIQYMIKDNKNRLVGKWENGEFDTAAIAGRSLRTYLDVELQQLAEKLMSNKVGAIVALEPKTGGILTMVSGPNYNPNTLTGSDKQKNYAKLQLDVAAPLLNRAIKGLYPAGSTYKPLAALIGLDEGVITPRSGIACSGTYYGCGKPYGCTEHWAGHAANLRMAIAHSCNSFFYNTFRLTVDNPKYKNPRKGLSVWKDYMSAFGYGNRLGVDIPSENRGFIPDTLAYDKEQKSTRWSSCTMVTMGIGQDKMSVTPLQIANGISIVANKGYYYTPHFVRKIDDESENDSVLVNKFRRKHEVLSHIPDSVYEVVIDGMHDVTLVGTAHYIPKIPGIEICAKTGTAQNERNGIPQKDHSLFVCFAPRENPKIVVAVIVQNGGFGATWAGPMAYLLVEKYLKDTLRAEKLKEVDRIANANLMPAWLPREQYKQDSIRAYYWYRMTKDSSYIQKYARAVPQRKSKRPVPMEKVNVDAIAILPDEQFFRKKATV